MKVLLLAGGFGTRMSEESRLKPKPMTEIGEMPIIWHIMKGYSYYGFNDFVILAGYKQSIIKEWFSDYFMHNSDITFDFSGDNQTMKVHHKHVEPWKVTIVDTGLNTMTGGRVKRAQEYVGNETFMLNYADAVGDVNIGALVEYHRSHGKIGTMSVYNFGQSKGVLDMDGSGEVTAYREKSNIDGDLINIGFMVFEPQIFDYIAGDDTVFEKEPLNKLVEHKQLNAFVHKGFWQCMDTVREKEKLEELWNSGQAPWKEWQD